MDYKIGDILGNHVSWYDVAEFDTWNGQSKRRRFSVFGHHPTIPKKGDLLTGEFKSGTVLFKFKKVKKAMSPQDMFFGQVRFVRRL